MDGVTFGVMHSYEDWGLYLTEKPSISPPAPKTDYIDVPGSNEKIDFSDIFGDVFYEYRTITCTFLVIHRRKSWDNIYSEILNYLQGQKMNIILDDDPSFYWVGRAKISEWKSNRKNATVVIEATVEPYKYELASSIEDWLWDPFNFETGIIREYGSLTVDGTLVVNVIGRREKVIPEFIVNSSDKSGMNVIFQGVSYHLDDGISSVINIETSEGDNLLTIQGTGTISIDYRGGSL